jgi:hypothetical protein
VCAGCQRLEIEFLSCTANSAQSPQTFDFVVGAEEVNGGVVSLDGVVKLFARDSFLAAGAAESEWSTEAKVLMHVPAGGKLAFQVAKSVTGQPWGAGCSVRGYLVSVP